MTNYRKIYETGTRVTLRRNVDRFPHCIVPKGAQGTVTEYNGDDGVFGVRLDLTVRELAEWENVLYWEDSAETLRDVLSDVDPEEEGRPCGHVARPVAYRPDWCTACEREAVEEEDRSYRQRLQNLAEAFRSLGLEARYEDNTGGNVPVTTLRLPGDRWNAEAHVAFGLDSCSVYRGSWNRPDNGELASANYGQPYDRLTEEDLPSMDRESLLEWLAWNDRDGVYRDVDVLAEYDGDPRHLWTEEGAREAVRNLLRETS